MNPARSLAPALLSGQLNALWIYLLAPVAGTALAYFTCRLIQGPQCCPADVCAMGEGGDCNCA
jgi:aquaporin Z